MTITQNTSAPLVAVVGATGNQGGSVIKALEESDKAYRIRAFTRDATKPAAQELKKKGAEVVAVSLIVDNKDAVYKAFSGADMAFLVTNFWEHMSQDKEVAEGKLLIDAAKAAGVSKIVWSGLNDFNKISAGKYAAIAHFDGKASVTAYGHQCGVPFVDVQAGFYASNFSNNPMMLAKQADGTFVIPIPAPVKASTLVPVLDTARDYGLYVRQVLELPEFPHSSAVYTGQYISFADIASQLSDATGKKVVFQQISPEQFTATLSGFGFPAPIILEMQQNFQIMEDHGYYNSKPVTPLTGVGRKARTWAEFVKATDWSKVLA